LGARARAAPRVYAYGTLPLTSAIILFLHRSLDLGPRTTDWFLSNWRLFWTEIAYPPEQLFRGYSLFRDTG